MNEINQKNPLVIWSIITAIGIIAVAYYYYHQSSQSQIISQCNKLAISQASYANARQPENMSTKEYNDFYQVQYLKCLRQNGLEDK